MSVAGIAYEFAKDFNSDARLLDDEVRFQLPTFCNLRHGVLRIRGSSNINDKSRQNIEVQYFTPLWGIPQMSAVSELTHCYVYLERIVGNSDATDGVYGMSFGYFLQFPSDVLKCTILF